MFDLDTNPNLFRKVNDYPDYLIKNTGELYSIKSKKFLKQFIDRCGYAKVYLSKNNKRKMFLVHRLVAIHFIDNPKNKEQVNHIDGNKANNNVSNLEWATRSENVKHAYRNNLINLANKDYSNIISANKKRRVIPKNEELTIKHMYYKEKISMREIGRRYGVTHTTISKVIKDKYWRD